MKISIRAASDKFLQEPRVTDGPLTDFIRELPCSVSGDLKRETE